jgi:hypothetical protein
MDGKKHEATDDRADATPEMVAAGVDALTDFLIADRESWTEEQAVLAVFRAMDARRPR